MHLEFETLDVFTTKRFAGNPLAVVWGAEKLSTETMQTITREFNLSETVFILPAEDNENTARLRIFTPGYEMPFAGHPTVGAAIAIAARRKISGLLRLELNAGLFPVNVEIKGDEAFAEFENPNPPKPAGQAPEPSAIEKALSLPAGSLDHGDHRPRLIDAGVSYVYACAPFDVLTKARFDSAAFEKLALGETVGVVLYASAPGDDRDYRVRMFAPGAGVPEDPATGSAAAAFPGQLAAAGALTDGDHRLVLHQGVEMGRPSVLRVSCNIAENAAKAVRVSGNAVFVQKGQLTV